jgi:hypothetical protein
VTALMAGDTNCPLGGVQITDGGGHTAYACNGAPGAAGASGLTSLASLNGLSCTSSGGAAGSVSVSVASNNAVTLQCSPSSTNANCTHSDGLGQNYTDCNDLLGTPGDASTYNSTMAMDAAQAWVNYEKASGLPNGETTFGPLQTSVTDGCLDGDFSYADVFSAPNSQGVSTLIAGYTWFYDGPNAGAVDAQLPSGGCTANYSAYN